MALRHTTSHDQQAHDATRLSSFHATSLNGADVDLAQYLGKVVLVVNTASKCGLTPQFAGLEELYRDHAEQGFVVLGFPCNQFANQDPGTEAEIGDFCRQNYGVTFPMFAKVDVNGDDAHPLFVWLRSQQGGVLGNAIKWNFTKFLIGRDGAVRGRYAPTTKPADLEADIVSALAEPAAASEVVNS